MSRLKALLWLATYEDCSILVELKVYWVEGISYAMRSTDWIKALKTLDPEKIWTAGFEVLVIGAISLAPLVLAAIGSHVSAVINGDHSIPLSTSLAKAILSGQLLFYAMSFVGSIVWHSSRDLVRPFPLRIWFIFFSFCFGMICALTIGVDPTLEKLSVPFVYYTSVVVYGLSTFLYFVILVFRSMEEVNFQRALNEDETEFEDRLRASRGMT